MRIACEARIIVAVVVKSAATATSSRPSYDVQPVVQLGSRASNAHLRVLLLKDLKLVGEGLDHLRYLLFLVGRRGRREDVLRRFR